MAGFPQREAVGKLEDEEDEEDGRYDPPQDEISDERHVSLPTSSQPWAKDAPASVAGKYSTRVAAPRASLEDDEMTGITALSASDDPLGDVIDWLAFADLGEDDPGRANQVGTYFGDSPGTPSAASSHVPALPSRSRGSRPARAGYCGLGEPEQAAGLAVDPEEEEWDVRQRQTGAAGRLVTYCLGERPDEDVHLRGGGQKRLMVAGVKRLGKAEQAGVKSGDVLVSIDGKKDFTGLGAEEVHRRLRAPVTLVFMGFVGKLQAEVRLNYRQRPCGLASKDQVAVGRPDAPMQVVDEVVFQPTTAPLFLAVNHELPQTNWPNTIGLSAGDDGDVGDVSLLDDELEELGVEFTGPILAAALEESNFMEASSSAAAAAAGSPPEEERGSGEASRQGSRAMLGGSFRSLFGGGREEEDAVSEAVQATPAAASSSIFSAVYELRGQEARSLVTEALSFARPMLLGEAQPDSTPNVADTPGLEPVVTPASPDPWRRPEESSLPELLPFKQFSRIGGFVQDEWQRGSRSNRDTCDEGLWQTPFGGRCERKTGF